jgi:hypothetical protein
MRVDEPLLPRLDRIPPYALTFTGHAPSTAEVKSFRDRHIEAGHSQANRISKSST